MKVNFQNISKIRVRYGETDQMGYCYYGNYAQYFEVGRVEALRDFGFSYKEMELQGVMLPVSEFQVKYLGPAFYDDELSIVTKIVSLRGAQIYFEYDVLNPAGKCISKASTTLVFVSKVNMRPIQPPVNFIELMKKYEAHEV
jgi:acyl-CoA thioester hydrolase